MFSMKGSCNFFITNKSNQTNPNFTSIQPKNLRVVDFRAQFASKRETLEQKLALKEEQLQKALNKQKNIKFNRENEIPTHVRVGVDDVNFDLSTSIAIEGIRQRYMHYREKIFNIKPKITIDVIKAEQIIEQMKKNNVEPNLDTYLLLLRAFVLSKLKAKTNNLITDMIANSKTDQDRTQRISAIILCLKTIDAEVMGTFILKLAEDKSLQRFLSGDIISEYLSVLMRNSYLQSVKLNTDIYDISNGKKSEKEQEATSLQSPLEIRQLLGEIRKFYGLLFTHKLRIDIKVFNQILRFAIASGDDESVRSFVNDLRALRLKPDTETTQLIQLHAAETGDIQLAEFGFQTLLENQHVKKPARKDINLLLLSCLETNNVEKAKEHFNKFNNFPGHFDSPDALSFHAMIEIYLNAGLYAEAENVSYIAATRYQFQPTPDTYQYFVDYFLENDQLDRAKEYYRDIKENSTFLPRIQTFNSFISYYLQSNEIENALEILQDINRYRVQMNSSTLSPFIQYYIAKNDIITAEKYFSRIQTQNLMPFTSEMFIPFFHYYFNHNQLENVEKYLLILLKSMKRSPSAISAFYECRSQFPDLSPLIQAASDRYPDIKDTLKFIELKYGSSPDLDSLDDFDFSDFAETTSISESLTSNKE